MLALLISLIFPVCNTPGTHNQPAVAFGGGYYLVVWHTYLNGTHQIRAARVDTLGNVLEPGGIILYSNPSPSANPAVAAGDSTWLVAWETETDTGLGMYGDTVYASSILAAEIPYSNPFSFVWAIIADGCATWFQGSNYDLVRLSRGNNGFFLMCNGSGRGYGFVTLWPVGKFAVGLAEMETLGITPLFQRPDGFLPYTGILAYGDSVFLSVCVDDFITTIGKLMSGSINIYEHEFTGDTFAIPSASVHYWYEPQDLIASAFGNGWFLLLSPKAYEDGLSLLINRHDTTNQKPLGAFPPSGARNTTAEFSPILDQFCGYWEQQGQIYGAGIDTTGAIDGPYFVLPGRDPDVAYGAGRLLMAYTWGNEIWAGFVEGNCGTVDVGGELGDGTGLFLGVYPNPSSGQFTIRFSVPQGARYTLRLYDSAGRLVREMPDINGEQLSPGVYILRLETDRGSVSRRVVIN